MQLDQFGNDLKDTFQRYWKPALTGAALGGTGAAYAGRNAGRPGESGGERRRRMLKNALIGSLLGGTAGLAIPAGFNAATAPLAKADPLAGGPVDAAVGFGAKNILPVGVGAIGGRALAKSVGRNEATALQRVFDLSRNTPGDKGQILKSLGAESPEMLRNILASDPSKVDVLHKALATAGKGGPDVGVGAIKMRELLTEAGMKPSGQPKMTSLISHLLQPKGGSPVGDPGALGRFLAQEGGATGKLLGRLTGGTGRAAALPEMYRQLLRPSIAGRLPMIGKLGLLGGAIYGGKKVQDRLTGS